MFLKQRKSSLIGRAKLIESQCIATIEPAFEYDVISRALSRSKVDHKSLISEMPQKISTAQNLCAYGSP